MTINRHTPLAGSDGRLTPDRFPDAPPQIRALPRDRRGFPVPWFTPWIDGEPCFQAADAPKIGAAVRGHLCWICGRRLGDVRTFLIGPMCAVNRISSEPPSHWACAVFAATACPFMTKPLAKRGPRPEGAEDPAGFMIERNPGVALAWATQRHKVVRVDGGRLFQIGPPRRVAWFAQGRAATREEVLESMDTGLPALRELAEREGPLAVADLERLHQRAMKLIPQARAA